MPLLRRILFYVFALVYCIVCPLIVFYSLGFIFKPGGQPGISKTGLIVLSSVPSGASVYVENKRFSERTPTMIQGLLPGDYRVAVYLKGYGLWQRTVPVLQEKAAVFDKIVLLPKTWKYETILADEFNDLVPLRNSRFFLLSKGPLLEDLFFYDPRDEVLSPVVPDDFPFKAAHVSSYFMIDKSESLLLRTQLGLWGEEKFFWLDLGSSRPKIRDVTHLFLERPQSVNWDPDKKEQIFAYKDGELTRMDVASGAVYPRFAEHVRAYGLFDKKVYLIRGDSSFKKVDREGKTEEDVGGSSPLPGILSAEEGFFEIKVFSKDHELFLSPHGALLAGKPPYRIVGDGVKGIEPDPRSKKVLVWQNDKLGVLSFGESVEMDWVWNKGRKISQAFWVDDGSHVLFHDGNSLYFLELNASAPPALYPCFEVKTGSSVLYRDGEGKIYFLEKDTGRFCSATLVPKYEI